jgi:hypothetical protein
MGLLGAASAPVKRRERETAEKVLLICIVFV